MQRIMKQHARFLVATIALAAAFALSIQFSDRGVEFELHKDNEVAASETRKGEDEEYGLSQLRVLNRVLLQIKDNYVEPDRIDPNKMLFSALDEIQNAIAEVVIRHEEPAKKGAPRLVKVRVNDKKEKTFEIGQLASLWEMSFKLKEIFQFIETRLDRANSDVKFQEIEYAAINGMLSTLDPHSTLLPPQNYEEMQTQTGGKFGGLGIVISVRDGNLTVISPIEGTPAARKGIKSRDQIMRIGEESTVNMDLTEAVNMMRGEPGTPVDLWVLRKPWTEPKKFTIERAIIKIESVSSQPLADKVGYLRIKNFQANTFADTKKHLRQLKKKMGGMQGLVLDMRDNPGGLLDQAIKISDLFLDQGTIVSTVGVSNKLREKKSASSSGTEPTYPIVVLLNPGSASASEIVAGALKNNNRAMVLGDTSFGKGSVQVLYPFPDKSALKLTVAQYLTPGDVSIQGRGIRPDLRTVPVSISDKEIDMFLPKHVLREGDLASALENKASAARKAGQQGNIVYVPYFLDADPAKAEAQEEEEEYSSPSDYKEDFEIRVSQKMLANVGSSWRRADLLESIKTPLATIEEREQKTIQRELAAVGVDWSKGSNPAKPTVSLKVETDRPGDKLTAGETVKLTAALTNEGSEPLYQLKAITDADLPSLADREFIFGKLAPGETRRWTVEVQVPKDTPDRYDLVRFELSDNERELDLDATQLALRTEALQRPHFAFHYELIDANGDGLLQVDEEVIFRVHVKNVGQAASAETLGYLRSLTNRALYLEEGRAKVDTIKAGEEVDFDFKFRVKSKPEDTEDVEFEIDVYDTTFREFTQKKVKVPFGPPAGDARFQEAAGTATIKAANGNDAQLFTAASPRSDVVATATTGATLPVVAVSAGWLKVNLGDRAAYVQKSQAQYAADKTEPLAGVAQRMLFQGPDLELMPETMLTSKKSITLKGKVADDSTIKDYYIFVYNRDGGTVNTKKLSYANVGKLDANFSAKVPLFPGMNRVAVVVRDKDGMSTTQSAYVHRKKR